MRVLLADDHPLALAAVRVLLEGAADLEVVGEARSGSQVLPRAREAKPDIVVLDLNLPELDGLTCLERLTAEFPKAAVVVCSGEANEDDVEAVRLGGARAFVAKAGDPDEIPVALRAAAAGEPFRVYGAPERRRRPNEDLGLSERETTLLQTLARGLSNQEIGKELWITEQTVKFHLTNVYRKLGVENRTQATRVAYEHGLV
ncbi:MAG: response regulator transcription factor [Actinobacteria bacterium]|nr:MAG: response regulator transcription factor [Actinomycetota bacterium]